MGGRLGEGIAGLVNVLDPDVVVVGRRRGRRRASSCWRRPRRAFEDAVEGAEHRPHVPIVPAALGNDAGAIGAAASPARTPRAAG